MNGNAQVLQKNAVIFPSKSTAAEVSETKNVEVETTQIKQSFVIIRESRFARLKKSLRKRSAGIL